MPQYKDFIIIHPRKGKIKLSQLSHNEMCRYCFNLIIECSRLREELKLDEETKEDEPEASP